MSKDVHITPKLSDAQLVLLSAAAQRSDGLVAVSERTPALTRTVAALFKRGLLTEVPVRRKDPTWRTDESNKPIGLKITAFAQEALGLGDPEPNVSDPVPTASEVPAAARPKTKRALIVSLLQREQGAALDDLVQATGWLPHTTRAALTGLRQSGLVLDKAKEADGRTVYRITAPAQQAA